MIHSEIKYNQRFIDSDFIIYFNKILKFVYKHEKNYLQIH